MKPKRKDLDKIVKNSIKAELKNNGVRSRGGIYYKKIGQYFIYILIGVTGMENDYLEFRGLIKLYIVDDIFWEVFDMASNSNEPIGLRANGAFVVDGYQATLKKQNFEDTQELEEASRNLLIAGCAELESYIQNFDSYADFLSFSQSHRESKLYGYDLMNMLLLINDKKYSEAKSIAEDLISKREFAGLATKGSILTNIS